MAGLTCTQCGYENASTRGACLMCLNYLSNTDGGQPCGECGTDNPRNARFCGNCGGTLDAGAVPAPSGSDLAARVVEAVGGAGVALGGDVGGGSSYADVADMGAEPAGDELAPAELTGLVPDKPAPDEPLPEEIPGPMLEAPAQESAVGLGADEDFEIPAPPGVVESAEPADDDFAPPPPPGVVGPADADEFSAPPPPPGALDASDDDFAPPPPPGAIDAGEDEAVPPPPPPPPPGAASEGPDGDAAAGQDSADKKKDDQDSDEGLSDWELEFSEE